jgi:hypothetical protein
MPAQINKITNANTIPNSRYNTYGLIDSHFIWHHKLKCILIEKQKVFAYNN